MIDFDTTVAALSSVGKTTANRLARIGITTARDLLWNIPRTHEDLSHLASIVDLEPNTKCTVRVKISDIHMRKSPRKRMFITEALVADETGEIKVVWFNQPYIIQSLKVGDEIFMSGTIKESDLFSVQMQNPTFEKVGGETTHTARIVPLYHLTAGLTQKQLRFLIKQVLPLADAVDDYIPNSIVTKRSLMSLGEALRHIHFPDTQKDFIAAQTRLKFDELFLILLSVELAKKQITTAHSPEIKFHEKVIKNFVQSLPFTLTDDQRKTAWEVFKNMQQPHPMNRLLQGDVGAGKTIVAALAALNAITDGHQVVIMAPTDILAQQHFNTFKKLFSSPDITTALFTRTSKRIATGQVAETLTKKKIAEQINSGTAHCIIGTHALLHEAFKYESLALVIIDEQHRFGVEQRQQLKDTTPNLVPHFLSMTATPIPRSLALTLYGDLDISIIKQKPKNRKPIKTELIDSKGRDAAYAFVRNEVAQGNQAFVICPLVEESDKLGVKSATQEYALLQQNIFSDLRVGLVHGKLKKQEKELVIEQFRSGDIDILVATAVVEVGVDIPNATIMLIEASERFGLAQLHQFRGRVGRSDKQSYCLLFTNSTKPETKQRLQSLTRLQNGFDVAEYDLQFRGPGDMYGYKQSGLPAFNIASLADIELLEQAKEDVQTLLKQDAELIASPTLQQKLAMMQPIHFE